MSQLYTYGKQAKLLNLSPACMRKRTKETLDLLDQDDLAKIYFLISDMTPALDKELTDATASERRT